MATWRQRREWHREFEYLGDRDVRQREAGAAWGQEKCQEARKWLRRRELP
jgi:hypothetical protein